jgi:hypothetical protein
MYYLVGFQGIFHYVTVATFESSSSVGLCWRASTPQHVLACPSSTYHEYFYFVLNWVVAHPTTLETPLADNGWSEGYG